MSKQRIGDTEIVYRDERSGRIVHEYRVAIEGGGELLVQTPPLLVRVQATEVVDQLRSLIYDVSSAAGLDNYEASAREELLRACEMVREGSREPASTLERAQQMLGSYVYFIDAVEAYLRSAAGW